MMNSTKFKTATQSRLRSSEKRSYASLAVVVESERRTQATAVSDATMDQLAAQMRANLIRNVAEASARPVGDPAEWEI
jgi:hypothetical protein